MKPVGAGETLIRERQLTHLARLHQSNEALCPAVDHLLVESPKQRRSDPEVAPLRVESERQEVSFRAADPGDRHPDEGLCSNCDSGRLVRLERLDDVGPAVGSSSGGTGSVDEPDDFFERGDRITVIQCHDAPGRTQGDTVLSPIA